MGYEVKLIVGEVLSYDPDAVKTLLEICRVDLCKPGYGSHTGQYLHVSRKAATEHFQFFADNGNDLISEDAYGEPLPAVDIDGLITAMEADQVEDAYRRFSLALAMLRELRTWDQEPIRLKVIQYGH
jgi:hypothetical protein